MGPRCAQENDQGIRDIDLCRHRVGDRRDVSGDGIRSAGGLLRPLGRRCLQLVLQRVQLDSVSAARARRRGGAAAEGHSDDHSDSRPDRLDRHVPVAAGRIPEAQGARVRASRRCARRVERPTNVHAHFSQCVARCARANVDPRRRVHQVRSDLVVLGLWRSGRRGFMGLDVELRDAIPA